MDILTSGAGFEMLMRWGHFLAGITWIGLLYYFNFVQTEFFKEADAAAKSDAIRKLVPRALWWFRWGAMFTFLTGVAIFAVRGAGMPGSIYIGALLGTFMFLNVWLIIWPNQQIVIASAEQVAGGGEALPDAAGALGKAGLASRTNTLFSIPMLFFMGASSHFPLESGALASIVAVILILVLQYNATYSALSGFGIVKSLPAGGKMGPMASVKGVIHCGVGLTVVLFVVLATL